VRARRPWQVAGAVAAGVAVAACLALGFVYLDARQTLHDFYETRPPSATLHLHYPAMRRLALLAVAGATVAFIGACLTLRRWKLVAAAVLLAASISLVIVGLQQSPAAFSGPPRAHVAFFEGRGQIYPEPQRREFHFAALLAFGAAVATLAAALLAAVTSGRAPASDRSRAATDHRAHSD